MKFSVCHGNKASKDLILLIITEGYEQITFAELFTIVKMLYYNEDKIYSSPNCKGSKMLLEALEYLHKHSVSDTLSRFNLKKTDATKEPWEFFGEVDAIV